MAENSKIEWTTHTFNPWRGCTKVSEGCTHYYADRQSRRNPKVLGVWGPSGTRVLAAAASWAEVLKWNRDADCKCGGGFGGTHSEYCPQANRPRVFCASLADVFEDYPKPLVSHDGCALWRCDPCRKFAKSEHVIVQTNRPNCRKCDAPMRPAMMADARQTLFSVIDKTWNLDWLLVTKRPENIRAMWHPTPGVSPYNPLEDYEAAAASSWRHNVWLLASAEDQRNYDLRAPHLWACRDLCPVIGWSMEPLLGPIKMHHRCDGESRRDGKGCWNWVIVGGESGGMARPMHPEWARDIRDQCTHLQIPFFFKQWGEYAPEECEAHRATDEPILPWADDRDLCPMYHVGKKAAGRVLDGREWNEYPKMWLCDVPRTGLE